VSKLIDLFDLVAKITLNTREFEEGIDGAGKKASVFGDVLKANLATKGFELAAKGAAKLGESFADTVKQSIEAYADYEQLVGGVETLFNDSADVVQQYAANAYKTAGLSANEYMETVTSFSASLLQSLGGDTAAAADYADMAITDMSDNANKMGTSMESIQNAYQGFAKQNYTMLDNLKLGYGGTKEEMERLITDAEALDGTFKATRDENGDLAMSYADVVNAIHIVQTEMKISGITAEEASELVASGAMTQEEAFELMGTTAKEAATTISGSVASMKSAWQNLIVGIADENANFEELVNNFVESATTAAGNILPRVEQALIGIGGLVESLAPVIVGALPILVENVLPSILDSAVALVMGLVTGIVDNLPALLDAAVEMVFSLADGIINAIPQLIPAIVAVILTIVEKLTEPNTIMQLIAAAFEVINAVAQGLISAIPVIIRTMPTIMLNVVEGILRFLPQILASGAQLVAELAIGIVRGGAEVINGFVQLFNNVGNLISERVQNAKEWGSDLISNFINGIVAQAQELWNTIKNIGQGIRDLIGFSEPKKGPLSNFHTYAPDMIDLFAKGVKDGKNKLHNAVSDTFDFGDATVGTAKSVGQGASVVNSSNDSAIPIIVQCVLDGQIVSENTTMWQRRMARAAG
jgi:transcription termination factor NusB